VRAPASSAGGQPADDQLAPQLAAQGVAVEEPRRAVGAEEQAAADVVKLRLYAGFSVEEAADALAISRAQAYRHWKYARAWLRCTLEEPPPSLIFLFSLRQTGPVRRTVGRWLTAGGS
jgi:DNA-directed RNA polymerase specialized sigma24 family protein